MVWRFGGICSPYCIHTSYKRHIDVVLRWYPNNRKSDDGLTWSSKGKRYILLLTVLIDIWRYDVMGLILSYNGKPLPRDCVWFFRISLVCADITSKDGSGEARWDLKWSNFLFRISHNSTIIFYILLSSLRLLSLHQGQLRYSKYSVLQISVGTDNLMALNLDQYNVSISR